MEGSEVQLDISPDLLDAILPFFYGGNITLTKDQLLPCLRFANKIICEDLQKATEGLLEQHSEGDHLILTLTALLSMPNSDGVFSKISKKLFSKLDRKSVLAKYPTFLNLPHDVIKAYFTRYQCKMKTEDDVLEALIDWLLHNSKERTQVITPLLEDCIRTKSVSREQASKLRRHIQQCIGDVVVLHEFLCDLPRPSTRLPQLRHEDRTHRIAFMIIAKSSSGTQIQHFMELLEDNCQSVRQKTCRHVNHKCFPAIFAFDVIAKVLLCQVSSELCLFMQENDSAKLKAMDWKVEGSIFPMTGRFSDTELGVVIKTDKELAFYVVSDVGSEKIGTTTKSSAMAENSLCHFATYNSRFFFLYFGGLGESFALIWDTNFKKRPLNVPLTLPVIGKYFKVCQSHQFVVIMDNGVFHLLDLEDLLSRKRTSLEPKSFLHPQENKYGVMAEKPYMDIAISEPYLICLCSLPDIKLSVQVCRINNLIANINDKNAWLDGEAAVKITASLQTSLTFQYMGQL